MPDLSIRLEMHLESPSPAAVVLMIEPLTGAAQTIRRCELVFSPSVERLGYTDLYGNRCLRVLLPGGTVRVDSYVEASTAETIDVDEEAAFCPMEALPLELLHFVLPSRYCPSDEMEATAIEIAGEGNSGYRQVERIRDWIHRHMVYEYGSSDSHTSAQESFAKRKGVCRDFAHLGIALTRGLNIPARMVAGYLEGLEPMDLHAWYEAYIGDRWYTFDATQQEARGGRVVVAYGRDAADVAIATHFAEVSIQKLKVEVNRAY